MSGYQKHFGVGPKGGLTSLFLFGCFYLLNSKLGTWISIGPPEAMKWIGGGFALIAIVLYLWSVWTLRNWWLKDQLCTQGPFRWFRHPLYSAGITFLFPGIVFYMNSWIFFVWVALVHAFMHIFVPEEEKMMLDRFGDQYRDYAAKTGRFFPRF